MQENQGIRGFSDARGFKRRQMFGSALIRVNPRYDLIESGLMSTLSATLIGDFTRYYQEAAEKIHALG
jgi:hypothetical protein